MLRMLRFKSAQVFVWIILVLLILGLAGFGIGDILRGGLSNSVAEVGEARVTTQEFQRAMQRLLRNRQISMAQARELGFPNYVAQELATDAALDAELSALGLSVSRGVIQTEIAKNPTFQGADGKFSVEQARFVLDNFGMTEEELREDIRRQLTTRIATAALAGGARLPPAHLQTILAFHGEKRSFAWVRLGVAEFGGTPPAPGDDAVLAEYTANEAVYTLPEARKVTYALLDPAALAASVEIAEDELRRTYDQRAALYRKPERRSLQRLAFATAEEAAAALTRIAAGETTLLALAAERGLAEADVELGEKTAAELPETARAAVFGLPGPGIAGPVETGLGPGLFQVNAVLAASEIPFETVRDGIRAELARVRAREEALKKTPAIEDLVAGGARIEDLVKEAGMIAATVEMTGAPAVSGIEADARFREIALAAKQGIESDLAETADGRFFVLRIDEVRPAALQPIGTVRGAVIEALALRARREAVKGKAEALAAQIRAGSPFDRAAIVFSVTPAESPLATRGVARPGLPAELVAAVFAAPADGAVAVHTAEASWVARVTGLESFNPGAPELALPAAAAQAQLDTALGSDLFTYFRLAVAAEGNPVFYPGAIESVLSRFP